LSLRKERGSELTRRIRQGLFWNAMEEGGEKRKREGPLLAELKARHSYFRGWSTMMGRFPERKRGREKFTRWKRDLAL